MRTHLSFVSRGNVGVKKYSSICIYTYRMVGEQGEGEWGGRGLISEPKKIFITFSLFLYTVALFFLFHTLLSSSSSMPRLCLDASPLPRREHFCIPTTKKYTRTISRKRGVVETKDGEKEEENVQSRLVGGRLQAFFYYFFLHIGFPPSSSSFALLIQPNRLLFSAFQLRTPWRRPP